MKMDLFDVVVKLGDAESDVVVHSTPRTGITAIEIRLLRGIHGQQSIVKQVKSGTVEREETEEIHRLCMFYKPARVAKILGVEVHGWEQYADQQRTLLEEELNRRAQERRDNLIRSQAEATAAALSSLQPPQPVGKRAGARAGVE